MVESKLPMAQAVHGWKGESDAVHLNRLMGIFLCACHSHKFDLGEAERALEELRCLAYRRGLAAAQVFLFVDKAYAAADPGLAERLHELMEPPDHLPFLQGAAAIADEIESMRRLMPSAIAAFAGGSAPACSKTSSGWLRGELNEAFRKGRDSALHDAESGHCPIFAKYEYG